MKNLEKITKLKDLKIIETEEHVVSRKLYNFLKEEINNTKATLIAGKRLDLSNLDKKDIFFLEGYITALGFMEFSYRNNF